MRTNEVSRNRTFLPKVLLWCLISGTVGVMAGTASAGFLAALDWVTEWRESHLWILILLPVAGFGIAWTYRHLGNNVAAGNNLLLDEIHNPQAVVPLRMAPLILFGTLATHLFGGSAGREGTAVQMGATLADQLSRPLRLSARARKILLMAGMSAGFSSVFGTPLAGAVFGLEVLSIGRLRYHAIFPCFVAALIADKITLTWGIRHTQYAIPTIPDLTLPAFLYAAAAGVCFGWVARLFAGANHALSGAVRRYFPYPPAATALGGVVVAFGVWSLGTTRYIGLGIPTLVESFQQPLPPWDFAGKFLFTTVTLGSGFKGGEVTPLFFIGATLGNALAHVLSLPFSLLAGMGFVAVFAGAANTPLTCILMGMELFGAPFGVYAGIACVFSYVFSGHEGIYSSQRRGHRKDSLG